MRISVTCPGIIPDEDGDPRFADTCDAPLVVDASIEHEPGSERPYRVFDGVVQQTCTCDLDTAAMENALHEKIQEATE